jgi:hypothetical protein
MTTVYDPYSNIEASVIDSLKASLVGTDFSSVPVERGYSLVESGSLPVIVVSVYSATPRKRDIGSRQLRERVTLSLRVFATSDRQRMLIASWLKNYLVTVDIVYSLYEVTAGVVSKKTANGRVSILSFVDNRQELMFTEELEPEDKYRHIISCEVGVRGLI